MAEGTTLGVAFSHDSRLYGAPRSLLLALAAFPDPTRLRLVVPAPGPLAEAAVELGVRVTVHPRPELPTRLSRVRTALGVRRRLARWRPRWVYVNTMAHAGPVWAAGSLGLPVVLHVREHAGYFAPRGMLGRRRLHTLVKRPRRILCVSNATRGLVVGAGADPARTVVVYNGVDVEQFAPDPARRARERAELGVAEDEVLCGFVGQLIHRKGWDRFLAAAAAETGRARYLIVGASAGQPDWEAFEEARRRLPPGRLLVRPFARDTRSAYAAMDLFVSPSRDEPFARVNLEAMATGVPVVATDVGGNAEAVLDGETGRVVPSEAEPDALIAAVRELVDDPGRRRVWGEAGRARARAHFGADRYQRAVLAELESVAGEDPA